jgi:hypothetical protein
MYGDNLRLKARPKRKYAEPLVLGASDAEIRPEINMYIDALGFGQ